MHLYSRYEQRDAALETVANYYHASVHLPYWKGQNIPINAYKQIDRCSVLLTQIIWILLLTPPYKRVNHGNHAD